MKKKRKEILRALHSVFCHNIFCFLGFFGGRGGVGSIPSESLHVNVGLVQESAPFFLLLGGQSPGVESHRLEEGVLQVLITSKFIGVSKGKIPSTRTWGR